MAAGVQSAWSTTAATNATADDNINWREGQGPGTVNNSARAMMAAIKKWFKDSSGSLVTGGSSTAYTLTTNEGLTLADGVRVTCRMHASCGASPTLNVDSTGAVAIQMAQGTAVPRGRLIIGAVYTFVYYSSSAAWIVHAAAGAVDKYIGEVFDFGGSTAPAGSLLCYGQAISRTTYAALYAEYGTQYGVGDGSTTFNLPDCRGRARVGKDDMGGSSANRLTALTGGIDGDTLGATGGSESHTLTSAQSGQKAISSAPVTITDNGHEHDYVGSEFVHPGSTGGSSAQVSKTRQTATAYTGISAAFSLDGSDAASAHNNVQPSIVFNTCVYTGVY